MAKLGHKLVNWIVKLVDEITQNVPQPHAFLIDLEQPVGHKCNIAPDFLVKLGYKMVKLRHQLVSMENMVGKLVMLDHMLVSPKN